MLTNYQRTKALEEIRDDDGLYDSLQSLLFAAGSVPASEFKASVEDLLARAYEIFEARMVIDPRDHACDSPWKKAGNQ